MMIVGREAGAKAQATGEAILKRAGRLLEEAGFAPFSEFLIEVLGAESNYGADPKASTSREVILKIAVRHSEKEALNIFAGEIYPAACSMAQGITGFAGGRPTPQPVIRLFSFLIDKDRVPLTVSIADTTLDVKHSKGSSTSPKAPAPQVSVPISSDCPTALVPLIAIAHGRSGDKGDKANIGILARSPEYLRWIEAGATPERVGKFLGHFVKGNVDRFDWEGLNGFNFLLHQALGGGGVASLRHDPQGKALAQILLDLPVEVPAEWVLPDGQLSHYAEEASGS